MAALYCLIPANLFSQSLETDSARHQEKPCEWSTVVCKSRDVICHSPQGFSNRFLSAVVHVRPIWWLLPSGPHQQLPYGVHYTWSRTRYFTHKSCQMSNPRLNKYCTWISKEVYLKCVVPFFCPPRNPPGGCPEGPIRWSLWASGAGIAGGHGSGDGHAIVPLDALLLLLKPWLLWRRRERGPKEGVIMSAVTTCFSGLIGLFIFPDVHFRKWDFRRCKVCHFILCSPCLHITLNPPTKPGSRFCIWLFFNLLHGFYT